MNDHAAATLGRSQSEQYGSERAPSTDNNNLNRNSFDLDDDTYNEGGDDRLRHSSPTNHSSSPRGLHHRPQHQRQRPSAFVMHVTAMASLGGILFGYDLGVISSALPPLIATFDLTTRQQEICVSILYVGGGIGAAVGGSVCDAFGRKRAILVCDGIFGLGALVLSLAPTFGWVMAGRIIVGFAIALSGIADVTYLHEIAPVQFRGAIVSVNEACIALGFLLAFWVGRAVSSSDNTEGWRTMFGVSGLVALIQFFGMLPLPESPKWLAERGRHEESEIAQRRIQSDYILFEASKNSNNSTNINNTTGFSAVADTNVANSYQAASPRSGNARHQRLNIATDELAPIPSSSRNGGNLHESFMNCCCQVTFLYKELHICATTLVNDYRRQAYISMFLAVTQQLCGQANVLSYAPLIFAAASGKDVASSSSYVQGWATLSIGLVKFVVTVGVIWKVESIGRRVLLLVGICTIAAGLLLLAISFAGVSVVASEVEESSNGFALALPGVLLVVCGYSVSFGPLTWLLISELFPTDIRGRALGFSTIITYICASVVTSTFLTAQAAVGASVVFLVYCLITCTSFVFALLAIPDTGGKSPEEVEEDLKGMLWWQRRRIQKPIEVSQDENISVQAEIS